MRMHQIIRFLDGFGGIEMAHSAMWGKKAFVNPKGIGPAHCGGVQIPLRNMESTATSGGGVGGWKGKAIRGRRGSTDLPPRMRMELKRQVCPQMDADGDGQEGWAWRIEDRGWRGCC